MPADFIALDSSVLRGAGWPRVSADLENLLQLARMFKIPICVPEAVLLELEDFWKRGHQKRCDDAQAAIRKIEKVVRNIDLLRQLQIPDAESESAGSARDSAALIQQWDIQVVPITSRPVNEFFRMAARKEPPFRDKGVGFKDAVIFFSIIDYFVGRRGRQKDGRLQLVLVSDDSDFQDGSLVDTARNAGVDLSVVPSLQEMNQRITATLQEAAKTLVARDQELALAALQKIQPEIEKLLNTQMDIPPRELQLLGITESVSIKRVDLLEITNVRTPYLQLIGKRKGEPEKIAADLRIQILASVSRRVPPEEAPVRVGEQWLPSSRILAALARGRVETTDETIEKVAKLEATGTRTEEGYTDLANLSLTLPKESAFYGY